MLGLIKNTLGISRYTLTSVAQVKQYCVGQVWAYKTRHHEPHSRLSIVRIDKDIRGDVIIHTWIDHLQIKNPNHPDGEIHELPHTPFTVEALDSSLTHLDKTIHELPDQTEGYSIWHQAWKKGQASIFSMPVRELVDMVEASLCKGSQAT